MTDEEAGTVSRRNMMAGVAGAAVVTGAAGVWALPVGWYAERKTKVDASWWEREHWTLATAGLEEWTSQIDTGFVVLGETREVLMFLRDVKPFESPGERPPKVSRDRAFAVIFETHGLVLPPRDRIYRVGNPRYGEMDIHLKPCGDEASPGRVEAVFN